MSRNLIVATIGAALLTLGAAAWLARGAWRPPPRELIRQARSALAIGNNKSAELTLEQILSRQPDHPDANLLRADLAVRAGQFDDARRYLGRIPDRPAVHGAKARFRQGLIALQLGHAREAEQLFRKSLALDPNFLSSEQKLRELYMLQLRRDDFRQLMQQRRAAHPWQLPDLLDFIIAGHVPRLLAGNWIERVRVLAESDPGDLDSRRALAIYYAALEDYEQAASAAREVLEKAPEDPRAAALLAEALVNLDRIPQAQAVLAEQGAAADSHPWLLRCRARIAFLQQQYEQAAADFEKALALEPGNPTVLYLSGLSLQRIGLPNRAADRTRCATELANLVELAQQILKNAHATANPRDVSKQILSLARSLADCELWEDSQYCCELVLRLEPQNPAARDLYETVSSRRRAGQDAVALTTTPSSPAGPPAAPSLTARTRSLAPFVFADVAADCGLDFEYFTGNTGNKYLFETLGGGASAIDFDSDGWTDCYFAQGSHFPIDPNGPTFRDQLFRNRHGAAFEPVTDPSGLGDASYTIGCSAADFDNDGHTDLFLANYGTNRAFRNNGDGTFSDVAAEIGIDIHGMNTSLALADLDRDGDLDLYAVNYLASIEVCRDRSGRVFACHPTMFQAEQDRLLANAGDGRFHDVTANAGAVAPDGKGLGIVVADLDNDSWPDIYVANDTTANLLFRNLGGATSDGTSRLQFQECGLVSGAALSRDGRARAGMGIACADFDANGFLDLYVTNYYLETNALFLNHAGLVFVDSVRPASLVADTTPLLGFGTQPLDADLDGNMDLFVANGHVDDYRDQDSRVMWQMPAKLYRNAGQLDFDDVSSSAGPFFARSYIGRSVVRLDWNRDARPDLLFVSQNQPVSLLENRTATQSHRAVIEFVGRSSNREAINTRYSVAAGGQQRLTFELIAGDGYLVSNERREIIGLGDSSTIDELVVLWPSGRKDRFVSLPADRLIRIIEGDQPVLRPLEPESVQGVQGR